MRLVGWYYTFFVLAVVVHLARARRSTALEPIVWLVILLLATFRSPVLPIYGIFPIVWLVTILLAAQWDSLVVRWVLLVWFVALALLMPSWTLWPPAVHAIVTSVVLTVGSMVLAAAALRLKRPGLYSPPATSNPKAHAAVDRAAIDRRPRTVARRGRNVL